MNIVITGNHEINDVVKNYVSSQIVKLAKYTKKIESASAIITTEKRRYLAVIIIWADGVSFTGRASSEDVHSSIDNVFTKMESQLKKHKKRRNSKFRKQMNKRKFKFKDGIEQLKKELISNAKSRRRFRKIQNMVYATAFIAEQYIYEPWIELIGIV